MKSIQKTHVDVQRFLVSASFACGFAVIVATTGVAADPASPLLTIDWKTDSPGEVIELTEERPFPESSARKIVSPVTSAIKVGEQTLAQFHPLKTIENPGISKRSFAIKGWIRHTGVEGKAYLEMLVVFPDASHYFSRTLADFGPMKSLTGDSDWREFILPFQLSDDPQALKPVRLVISAGFPGKGEMLLSNLTLTEADNVAAVTAPTGAWWSDQAAGWVGGIGGSLLGLLGAVIGTLAGLGYARRLVTPLLITGIALGTVLLATGTIALIRGQPYGVYYPLLLGGLLCTVLGTVGIVVTRQRFAQLEMRRMQALDA